MNYLAHAYLSFNDVPTLTGNMIADHVKGKKALEAYPEGIQRGMHLHRAIDTFTDAHPAVRRAGIWFRPVYRLYSGPITDALFDHYLANDPRCFESAAALKEFSKHTYAQLDTQADYFPPPFAAYFPHMKEHDWLTNYRQLPGMQRSLNGLVRRAKHMPPADEAYRTFIEHYYELNQCYFELMDDLIPFVKSWTRA